MQTLDVDVGPVLVVTGQAADQAQLTAILQTVDLVAGIVQALVQAAATIELEFVRFEFELAPFEYVELTVLQAVAATAVELSVQAATAVEPSVQAATAAEPSVQAATAAEPSVAEAMVATDHNELATVQVAATTDNRMKGFCMVLPRLAKTIQSLFRTSIAESDGVLNA